MKRAIRGREGAVAVVGVIVLCVSVIMFMVMLVMPTNATLSSVVITAVKPSVLHPGETTEVTLIVKNNGVRDARDVRIEFKVSDRQNVSIVGSTVVQISSLDSWSERRAKIKVHVEEGVHEGVYTIPVTYSWKECYNDQNWGYICLPNTYVYDPKAGMGFQINKPVSELTFIVKGTPKLSFGEVYTEPAHIRPGDEKVKITAVIWNIGNANAKDIEVRLGCKDQFKASWSDAGRAYRARLNTGIGFSAVFYVDISENVEPGVYTLPLVISYSGMDNRGYKEEKEIQLRVEGKPELALASYTTEPGKITAGDHVRLRLRIENVGTEEARAVRVQPRAPFKFDMDSFYVGDLGVKEARDAIMGFIVDAKTSPGVYQQALELKCISRDNDTYSSVEHIPLEVLPVPMNASHMANMTNTSAETHSTQSPMVSGFYALMAIIGLLSALFILKERRSR